MTPSLMPLRPDAWHMMDPSSVSVVIVIVIVHLAFYSVRWRGLKKQPNPLVTGSTSVLQFVLLHAEVFPVFADVHRQGDWLYFSQVLRQEVNVMSECCLTIQPRNSIVAQVSLQDRCFCVPPADPHGKCGTFRKETTVWLFVTVCSMQFRLLSGCSPDIFAAPAWPSLLHLIPRQSSTFEPLMPTIVPPHCKHRTLSRG